MDLRSMIPFWRPADVSASTRDDPFATMRREMDRVFDEMSRSFGAAPFKANGMLSPKVDVAETDAGLEVTAELPGVEKDDISLDITDGVLTLKAEVKTETEEKDEKKQYHLIERSHGTYMRRFTLPFTVDEDAVEAKLEDGVLKITLPRSKEAEKAKKTIAISS